LTTEREEALFRIVVWIVSGIVLGLWRMLVAIIAIIQWFYVIIVGKRDKGMAEFCNMFNTQYYKYWRYITMCTNERVFPFEPLGKDTLPVRMKK
jgi:hypothetical protein